MRTGSVTASPARASVAISVLQSCAAGSVVGEHSTIFSALGERVVLSHIAEDRAIFARGAVKAALWGHGRKPGRYSMRDVLGLND
jgi:4-hydroxy-tetrahydrodipicolinate reductase